MVDVRDARGKLELRLHGIGTRSLIGVVQRLRNVFDLDASASDVYEVLSKDVFLRSLLEKNPGVRVPGAWDGFELTVRAILGQQVSVKAATTLAGRIADRYGERIDAPIDGLPDGPDRLFPEPRKLMRARLESLGIIGSRSNTIRALARAVSAGTLDFDAAQDADEFRRTLLSIKGIGDWTADYVAMRVLKNPDAFPSSDLGLLRAFDEPHRERLKPGELKHRAEAWRPWRAYAALLLWGSDDGAGG